MLKEISSKENQIIKIVRALQNRAGRKKSGLFFVEGIRITDEAAKTLPNDIFCIVLSKTFYNTYKQKAQTLSENFDCFIIPDTLFRDISDTDTPQGILAVMKIKESEFSGFSFEEKNILILDSLRDPGNIGTIIRTAEAMGFSGIFLTKGCADIYSPKVLRSTMGSVFRTNIYENCSIDDINVLKQHNYKIISTALQKNSVFLNDIEPPSKAAIVIGNEANGVSKEILAASDIIVKIPMQGRTESLNAAVAAGIVMYKFSLN